MQIAEIRSSKPTEGMSQPCRFSHLPRPCFENFSVNFMGDGWANENKGWKLPVHFCQRREREEFTWGSIRIEGGKNLIGARDAFWKTVKSLYYLCTSLEGSAVVWNFENIHKKSTERSAKNFLELFRKTKKKKSDFWCNEKNYKTFIFFFWKTHTFTNWLLF